jgi:hypothetical protein
MTPNHPTPANEAKKNPLVNCWFTEGSHEWEEAKYAKVSRPSRIFVGERVTLPMIPATSRH